MYLVVKGIKVPYTEYPTEYHTEYFIRIMEHIYEIFFKRIELF